MGLTGVVSTGALLVAHVAVAAWDPRGGGGDDDAAGADQDADGGLPLYRADISNAFLSLHLGFVLAAFLCPSGVAWATTVQAILSRVFVLVLTALPALGLAFASASGSTFLFFQQHALLGVWVPSVAQIVACRAPDWSWAPFVVVSALFGMYAGRTDMAASIAALAAVLGAGVLVLTQGMGDAAAMAPWTPAFVMASATLALTGAAQAAWLGMAVWGWWRSRRATAGDGAAQEGGRASGQEVEEREDPVASSSSSSVSQANPRPSTNGGGDDNSNTEEGHAPSSTAQELLSSSPGQVHSAMDREARDEFALIFHNMLTPASVVDAATRHRRPPPTRGGSGPMYMSLSEKTR